MSISKLQNELGTVYNVEKVKSNKAPRHFFDAEREAKLMVINGKETRVAINRDRTQYVLFQVVEPKADNPTFVQSYYVRDHKFFDETSEAKNFVKPSSQPAEQPKVEEVKVEEVKQREIKVIKAAK
jgi:hypothetical protein